MITTPSARWSLQILLPLLAPACAGVIQPEARPAPDRTTKPASPPEADIRSRLETTADGGLILIHEITLAANIGAVWAAYTTSDGWEAWVAPRAEVDLRPGGLIRTHYDPTATIGDPDTIQLRVVNFVPERLLTLQSKIDEKWPEFLAAEADNLYNVVLFEALGPKRTRLVSYGLGNKDDERFHQMMTFFRQANTKLYHQLKDYLERGQRAYAAATASGG